MDPCRLEMILNRYAARRLVFDQIAARRRSDSRYPQYQRTFAQHPVLLSHREIEVLQSVAAGETNAEIADRLFLSEETIKSHLRRILQKLNARSRAQAVAEAFRQGVLA
jgi:DNA-binding NarL/FixJ family response regulator